MASEKVASHVSEKLSLFYIDVNKTINGKAQDPEYRHHGIIKSCLDKGLEVPASLIVEVLENEIQTVDGESWSIISGFPNDTEQLAKFEKKVILSERSYSTSDTDII